jgi:NAD(P)-dependent dehydrogenase (short-subunit alcohol dehydrogenase family)
MSQGKWTATDLPRLDGRCVVITGANSGIGLVAARELGRAGARVVLAVRDTARGEAAAGTIPGASEVRRLDLADLASVRAFAGAWDGDLDVLINNAGVMAVPRSTTKDGFELQLATNHLGHFALTNRLLPHIGDRVVTVSSGAHRLGRIRLDDLNWERRRYDRWRAYGQSKLANLLFMGELDRRLRAAGWGVSSLAAHPGYAATNLQTAAPPLVDRLVMAVSTRVIAQSADMGALPTLMAATEPGLEGGTFIGPDGPGEQWGHPQVVGMSSRARDEEVARRLWDVSEERTGARFPV